MKLIVKQIGSNEFEEEQIMLDVNNRFFLFTGNDYYLFSGMQKLMEAFFSTENMIQFLNGDCYILEDQNETDLEELEILFNEYRDFLEQKINKEEEEFNPIKFDVTVEESDLQVLKDFLPVHDTLIKHNYYSAQFALLNKLIFQNELGGLDFKFFKDEEYIDYTFYYGDYLHFLSEIVKYSDNKIVIVSNHPEVLELINLIYVIAKVKKENKSFKLEQLPDKDFEWMKDCQESFVNMQGFYFYSNQRSLDPDIILPIPLSDKGFIESVREDKIDIKQLIETLGEN